MFFIIVALMSFSKLPLEKHEKINIKEGQVKKIEVRKGFP